MTSQLVNSLYVIGCVRFHPAYGPWHTEGTEVFLAHSPGTTLSTATRRISWTEPIMRRDVTIINTGISRKSDKGAVSGRSVSHQCVGFYHYTETLGYGDGQLPRVCRCVKKKKDEKGYFFLAVYWHVAQSSFTICRKRYAFTS